MSAEAEAVGLLASALPAERREELAAIPRLSETLSRQLEDAHAAWPDVPFERMRYLQRVARAIERRTDEPMRRVIDTLPAGDLYLAAACQAGDAAALAAFRAEHVPAMRQALRKVGISDATIDETLQRVLVMVLVGPPPQLDGYTGRGRLRSWLRSVAVRTGRRMAGDDHRGSAAGTDELDALPAAVRDPQLEVLRARYAGVVRDAFAFALASLADRPRTLLREYYIDGLTIDDLAARYKINRATAARWVAAARVELVTATHARLVTEAGIPSQEVNSVIQLVRSMLVLSVRALG